MPSGASVSQKLADKITNEDELSEENIILLPSKQTLTSTDTLQV